MSTRPSSKSKVSDHRRTVIEQMAKDNNSISVGGNKRGLIRQDNGKMMIRMGLLREHFAPMDHKLSFEEAANQTKFTEVDEQNVHSINLRRKR